MSTRHHYNMRLRLDMALSAANDGDLAEARRQIAEAWKLHQGWPDAHGLYQALHVALDEHERRDGDPQALADLVALEGGPDFAAALRASGWDEPPWEREHGAPQERYRAREFVRLTRRLAQQRLIEVSAQSLMADDEPVATIAINGHDVHLTAADLDELCARQRERDRRARQRRQLGEGTLTLTAADGQSATFGTVGGTLEVHGGPAMPAQPRPGLTDAQEVLDSLYAQVSPSGPRNRRERRAAERNRRGGR